MTKREKAVEALGRVIGELERWQHRYRDMLISPERDLHYDVNSAKSDLMRLMDRIKEIDTA